MGGAGVFPSLSVDENLQVAGWLHRHDPAGTTAEMARLHELFPVLAERGLDAVLVTELLNVRYLTGFTGSNGALLVRADGADLFGTDGFFYHTGQEIGSGDEAFLVGNVDLGFMLFGLAFAVLDLGP